MFCFQIHLIGLIPVTLWLIAFLSLAWLLAYNTLNKRRIRIKVLSAEIEELRLKLGSTQSLITATNNPEAESIRMRYAQTLLACRREVREYNSFLSERPTKDVAKVFGFTAISMPVA
ncbi:MAG: hypothetical protein V4543_03970 [Bacteroidota bacterium]